MPNDLDPDRFTLRQAAQARDDFAQVIDELDFVKEQLARLPTQGSGFHPASHNVRQCDPIRRPRHPLVRGILAALPLSEAPSHRPCTHRS
jgi:hypothetical protein